MANGRDVDTLLASVNAASAKGRATWIALLSFGAYLAVAVGATTHRDLLLESPISLPILGVNLPLIAFYVVAPFLFLIMHLYLLVNLYVLGRRIHLFEERLPREVPVRADQERVRARLDPFIVLLHVAGRMAAPVPRFLLALTVWITVVLAPVILLIFFQVQFLPYHSEGVTWVHRGLIVADLLLLWLLWPSALHPSGRIGPVLAAPFITLGQQVRASWQTRRPAAGWGHSVGQAALATVTYGLSIGVLVFAFLVATVPDEPVEAWIRNCGWFETVSLTEPSQAEPSEPDPEAESSEADAEAEPSEPAPQTQAEEPAPERSDSVPSQSGDDGALSTGNDESKPPNPCWTLSSRDTEWREERKVWWLTNWLFEGELNEARARLDSFFSRSLVLPDADLISMSEDGLAKVERTLTLRARNLRYAILIGADLRKVEFVVPDLHHARLDGAKLTGARFACADRARELEGRPARPENCPQLQGASLDRAQLQGASLDGAQLQGASLEGAQLQGASLAEAQLQGASLFSAQLQGASLDSVQLQGASLFRAQLQGASLFSAQLQGASFEEAQLQGASLEGAKLQGARLHEAQLQGAWLDWAQLQGASLRDAQLQGASLDDADLQGASLDRTGIWRADISGASETALLSCIGSHFNPLTAEDLDELDDGLEAIPEGERRQRAQARVKVLRAPADAVDESALQAAWNETLCPQYDPQHSDQALADLLIREVICHSDMIVDGRAVGAAAVYSRIFWERFAGRPRPYHTRVARAVLEVDQCKAVREAYPAEMIAHVRNFLDRAEPAPLPALPPGKPAEPEPDPVAAPASGARTVLDLGCGDGDLLARLVHEPQIERIVGIDLSLEALQRLRKRLGGLDGKAGAHVDLVRGSMSEPGAMPAGFDCAILIETIEHIDPERLSAVERSVFGIMRPATVVVTTPNADFNPLLGVPSHRFRHPDHRFEWGREKFRRWAQGVAERNGYGVSCSDVAGRHPVYGGASQMAVFERPVATGCAPRRNLQRRMSQP